MMTHDPMCPAPGSTLSGCICADLRKRDARVRADAEFWERRWREAAEQREQMQVERDAARAEVRSLVNQVDALLRDESKWGHNIRREVLADLRAKVEGLRERGDAHADDCPGRPGMRGICACDGNILVSRTDVLALLDEVQP